MSDSNFWSEDIQGAVSLTFDDGALTQLDNAIPCLDNHDLKGTFYVNPGRRPDWEDLVPRWQDASRNGHEIGNHTTKHPCACNFKFSKEGFCLEKMKLEDIAQTIDDATDALNELFPEQDGSRTFCYPCYQSYVGAGERRASYVPVVAKRFKAARGWGERPNYPELVDLSYAWSWAVEGNTAEEMIAYIEGAADEGQWAIICMHGVGGQHLAIDNKAFNGLVDHLDKNRHRIKTDTMIGVAEYIISNR
jgi:peptidoglycan/xylan/chitin deacetylase (PgdA/CDA1 family)